MSLRRSASAIYVIVVPRPNNKKISYEALLKLWLFAVIPIYHLYQKPVIYSILSDLMERGRPQGTHSIFTLNSTEPLNTLL